MNINKYAKLNNAIDSLLTKTNEKMTNLIEEYNESISEEDSQIDTVDLDNKFNELADYIEDYS